MLTARVCALVVAVIGLVRLIAVVSGYDAGVDQWLFPMQVANQLPIPSRIAPNAALDFLLLGSALVFVGVRNRSVRLCVEFAAIASGAGSLLAILGYAYNLQSFYRLGEYIPMALNTAVVFSALIVAVLLSHTDTGLLAVFAGDSSAGTMARRLLPAAILAPAGLGWLTLRGEEAGLCRWKLGEAIFAVGIILVFTFLVGWSVRQLYVADEARGKAEEAVHRQQSELRALFDLIPAMILFKDTENNILRVNKRVEEDGRFADCSQ